MPCFYGSRVRAQLIGSAAVLALYAGAAQAQTADFYLPPQALSASLMEVARKTGENIIFSQQSLAGIQAPGLNGQMSARQAVERLIDGKNLQITQVGSDALVVRVVRQRRSDLSPPTQLIRVRDAPVHGK